MALQSISTAQLACTFGASPSVLNVLPTNQVLAGDLPAATIADMVPTTNIATFGMCLSPTNPTVASATAAASGVLTPMPCVPLPAGPWAPGVPKVLIMGQPALDATCTCTCTWAGVISIVQPGQIQVMEG